MYLCIHGCIHIFVRVLSKPGVDIECFPRPLTPNPTPWAGVTDGNLNEGSLCHACAEGLYPLSHLPSSVIVLNIEKIKVDVIYS